MTSSLFHLARQACLFWKAFRTKAARSSEAANRGHSSAMSNHGLVQGGPVEMGPGPGQEPPRKRLRHEDHEVGGRTNTTEGRPLLAAVHRSAVPVRQKQHGPAAVFEASCSSAWRSGTGSAHQPCEALGA